MTHALVAKPAERRSYMSMRVLADQALSRAAGAPLIEGNGVRLLRDARENYPAWLKAIADAQHWVHFENYIFREDKTGEEFAQALMERARAGVTVRVIYDWLGGFWKTSRKFWNRLRQAGVEVRCFNPPQFDAPLGWLSRDHRKVLVADGESAFVTGLCVGEMWTGYPEKNIQPWRDTGIEVRGPAVAEIERAFEQVWAMTGPPLPGAVWSNPDSAEPAGQVAMRIVATVPATAGMMRLDQLVAAMARERLWLTDAYYAGTTAYAQALMAAARGDVDVRLLVPSATDLTLLKPVSRAGYRALLEAGVRVFEWNGTMLHAKTAVADGRWARVGSTNLNIASWLGNCELDAAIEDVGFARQMEDMYLQDLANATEVVLDSKHKIRGGERPIRYRARLRPSSGSASRAAAGTMRIGNAISAAFTDRRTLEPVEARTMFLGAGLLLALGTLFAFLPHLLVYPLLVVFAWVAAALFLRGCKLVRGRRAQERKAAGETSAQAEPRAGTANNSPPAPGE